MIGPVIPGLNSDHIPELLKRGAECGAQDAGYIMVRLNGQLSELFSHWLEVHYPDKKEKVLNLIKQSHAGQLNDSQFGRRMKGSGPYAEQIRELFTKLRNRYYPNRAPVEYNLNAFKRPGDSHQLGLFNQP